MSTTDLILFVLLLHLQGYVQFARWGTIVIAIILAIRLLMAAGISATLSGGKS